MSEGIPQSILNNLLLDGYEDTIVNQREVNNNLLTTDVNCLEAISNFKQSIERLLTEVNNNPNRWDIHSVNSYCNGLRESQEVIFSLYVDDEIPKKEFLQRTASLTREVNFHCGEEILIPISEEEYMRQSEIFCSHRLPKKPPGAVIRNAAIFYSHLPLENSWFEELVTNLADCLQYSIISIGDGFTVVIISSLDKLIEILQSIGVVTDRLEEWQPVKLKNSLFVRNTTVGDQIQYFPIVTTNIKSDKSEV